MTHDTFGRSSGRRFAYYDRNTHSWRMYPGCGHGDYPQSLQTLPKTGSMRNGCLYELPTLGHHTGENGYSSLLPTLKASDGARGNSPGERKRRAPSLVAVSHHFPEIALLPTPSASESSGGAQHPEKR